MPPLVSGPGHKIRIPPELMPDDETIHQYLDVFFTHVHPYVPVLDRASFYRQWQTDRESVSPLVLEAIFALAGRIVDDPTEGQQWLALATSRSNMDWVGMQDFTNTEQGMLNLSWTSPDSAHFRRFS